MLPNRFDCYSNNWVNTFAFWGLSISITLQNIWKMIIDILEKVDLDSALIQALCDLIMAIMWPSCWGDGCTLVSVQVYN